MGLINTGQPFPAEDISQIAQDKDDVRGGGVSSVKYFSHVTICTMHVTLSFKNKKKIHTKCLQVADHTSYE